MIAVGVLVAITGVAWGIVLTRPADVREAAACTRSARPGRTPTPRSSATRCRARRSSTSPRPSSADTKIRVLNASGQGGQAGEVAGALRDLGFAQPTAANDPVYANARLTCQGQIRSARPGKASAAAVWLVAPCAELFHDRPRRRLRRPGHRHRLHHAGPQRRHRRGAGQPAARRHRAVGPDAAGQDPHQQLLTAQCGSAADRRIGPALPTSCVGDARRRGHHQFRASARPPARATPPARPPRPRSTHPPRGPTPAARARSTHPAGPPRPCTDPAPQNRSGAHRGPPAASGQQRRLRGAAPR